MEQTVGAESRESGQRENSRAHRDSGSANDCDVGARPRFGRCTAALDDPIKNPRHIDWIDRAGGQTSRRDREVAMLGTERLEPSRDRLAEQLAEYHARIRQRAVAFD